VLLQEDRRSLSTLWVFLDVRGLLTAGFALGRLPLVNSVVAVVLPVLTSQVSLGPGWLGPCWAALAAILGFTVGVLEDGDFSVSVCPVCSTGAPCDASRLPFGGFLRRAPSLRASSLGILLLIVHVVDALTVT
jgi:hypothetical protein